MRNYYIILTLFLLTSCNQTKIFKKNALQNDIYEIVVLTKLSEPEKYLETGEKYKTLIPGEIDTTTIKKLNGPLIALTAFYSAMGGTMCDGENCELTTALGLGKQGSDKHKHIIKKYFPDDKVAETLLKQNCYLRPSGASSFSDYEFLTITDKGDTVLVDYKLMYYNRGEIEWTEGPDIYIFKDNKFEKIKRNLWSYVDK